jgi:hypothetical protein
MENGGGELILMLALRMYIDSYIGQEREKIVIMLLICMIVCLLYRKIVYKY